MARIGKRTRLWDDLTWADLELSVSVPPNNATLLGPPSQGEAAE